MMSQIKKKKYNEDIAHKVNINTASKQPLNPLLHADSLPKEATFILLQFSNLIISIQYPRYAAVHLSQTTRPFDTCMC